MSELKKCPFCGSEAYQEDYSSSYAVICRNTECGARIEFRASTRYCAGYKAVKAWGRREAEEQEEQQKEQQND